jgi:hypothetical protein
MCKEVVVVKFTVLSNICLEELRTMNNLRTANLWAEFLSWNLLNRVKSFWALAYYTNQTKANAEQTVIQ